MPEITDPQLNAFLATQRERDERLERRNGDMINALVRVVTALDQLTTEIRRWREDATQ